MRTHQKYRSEIHPRELALAACLASILVTTPVLACESGDWASDQCPPRWDSYMVRDEDSDDGIYCDLIDCRERISPPPKPQLSCSTFAGRLDCEAWPRASGLTYRWRASRNVSLEIASGSTSPYQSLRCLSEGSVWVMASVTNSRGLSSSETFFFECLEAWSEYLPPTRPAAK